MKTLHPFNAIISATTLVVSLSVLTGTASAAQFKKTFPKIGAIEIAGHSRVVDPSYREALGKHDLVIIGLWRDWSGKDQQSGSNMRLRDVVVDIKAKASARGNPGILVGKYTVFNESENKAGGAKGDQYQKLNSEKGLGSSRDWWARNSSGANVSQWDGTWHTNVTSDVKRDAQGNTYSEWSSERNFTEFFQNTPELDIWYFDNVQSRPRVTADWNGDGQNDDRNNAGVRQRFRSGIMDAITRAKQLAPNVTMMGNVDYHPFEQGGYGGLQESEYKGQMIGLMEAGMGYPHSVETWNGNSGWFTTLDMYKELVKNAQQNVAVFEAVGGKTDYKMMRYGLTTALMDDGYFYYTDVTGSEHFKSAWWYDEYDVSLGKSVDTPPTAAWKQGVYMRRFDRGMAIVNPKANGRQTVSIPAGYVRINGAQDHSVNSGQPVSSVTLDERDGIILLKEGADLSPPQPPQTFGLK